MWSSQLITIKKNILFFSILLLISCKSKLNPEAGTLSDDTSYYTVAFGSCDNQKIKNELWESIDSNHPAVWIWGGDNVYSDTEDMEVLKANFAKQKQDPEYQNFIKNKTILGTWDDHDYGQNDGGEEYKFKKESQNCLFDFLDTPQNAPERKREGVYNSKDLIINGNRIKIIVLDSRYFRTALTKSANPNKRFQPNMYGNGTILGEAQWKWLKKELYSSKAQFNVIVSSIQFLSDKHGFECWGNFPHEQEKLEKLIVSSKAKGTFILSGDRHIALFSSKKVKQLSYPLVDFTSSGLTHTYSGFSGEENPYLKGEVIKEINFDILKFDFKNNRVFMEIRGKENKLLAQRIQDYNKIK
ncbi:alkaline phosphatase D family protein [Flavobacterium granuli]|uniref:Alkaline phosphatase D n=1 Tax=Flavobacterium granuli TaxID=280093 RepID=A0A1M5T4V1_9FLAO|nr:alkaline phosphatase D family protein [Flavobacterium granuli]PRZ20691.1 alkaline phosphatase D [Flavobacterium granuli]SHH45620.1 alkaline phosphatase D [Flavobacterium granuli]